MPARQTGSAKRRAETIYAMDDPAQSAIASADVGQILSGTKPVLIDEWQRQPGTWDAVRRAVDQGHEPNPFVSWRKLQKLVPSTFV